MTAMLSAGTVTGSDRSKSTPPLGGADGRQGASRSASITADFRPGAFALRDTWFPIIQTRLVGRRPVRRMMHGAPVHIWRQNGSLVATEDSPGGGDRLPLRASALTGGSGVYPATERYGYLWVWYGDPDTASPDLIPHVPHLPPEGGLPRHFQATVRFDCSYELVCENLLDLTHADFLHPAITGEGLSDDDKIEVTSTSETVTMVRTVMGRSTPKAQRLLAKSETQDFRGVTLVHLRSGVCFLHGDYRPGLSVRMLQSVTPETPTSCRTAVTFNNQRGPAWARHLFPLVSHTVGRQDNWALGPQNSRYLRAGGDKDVKDMNSRFDGAGLRYRKAYQALVERQIGGDYSYLSDGDPARDVTSEMGFDRP